MNSVCRLPLAALLCLLPAIVTLHAEEAATPGAVEAGETSSTRAEVVPPVVTPPAPALPPATIRPVAPAVAAPVLSESIRTVLENPEFSWRLPRVIEKKKSSFIGNLFDGLWKWTKAQLRPLWHWMKPYWEKFKKAVKAWLEKLQHREEMGETSVGDWRSWTRWALYGLAAVTISAFFYILYRLWKQPRRTPIQAQPLAVTAVPDLEDEAVSAADLPVDEWMNLARQLIEEGKWRHASRAVYLATLATLESHHLIRTNRAKSNGDYLREASRRAASRREVVELLGSNIRLFERGWYGTHEVTPACVETLTQNCSQIRRTLET